MLVGMLAMVGAVMALFWLAAIASFIAFIWALVDILSAKNDVKWKLLWVIVCLFLGIIGVIIYYFIGRKERKAPK